MILYSEILGSHMHKFGSNIDSGFQQYFFQMKVATEEMQKTWTKRGF